MSAQEAKGPAVTGGSASALDGPSARSANRRTVSAWSANRGTVRAAAILTLALTLAACPKPPPPPTLTSVTPDRGLSDRRVEITLEGERLAPRLFTDFSRRAGSALDQGWTARLGREALEEVALVDGALHAVVPAGLTPGRYDVVAVSPAGEVLTLHDGYQVLPLDNSASLVTAYRLETIGPQRVDVPFTLTVSAVDAAGAVVDAPGSELTLTDSAGAAVPRVLTGLAHGQWVGLVEVRAPRADEVLTVTDARGRTGSSNPFEVAPGPGASLRFSTPPRTVAAGGCSEVLTVEAADSTGLTTAVTAVTPLDLTATPGAGFEVFSDAACATRLAAPELAAGASSTSLHVRSTHGGPLILRASAAGFASALQTETVTAGPAARLAFTTSPHTVTAGVCSPVTTVEVRDRFDNPAPVTSALTIDVSAAPAAGFTFFGASGCASPATQLLVPAGSSSVDFAFQGTAVGVVTMTAWSAGVTDATQQARIIPQGAAARLAIVSAAQTTAIGACAGPFAVQTQDSLGNAVTNPSLVPVTLASLPSSGLVFFSDPACGTATTLLSLGVSQSTGVVYFVGQQPGAITAAVSSAGLMGDSQVETVLAGPPTQLSIVSPSRTVPVDSCSPEVTVQVVDALGFATTVATPTAIGFTATPPGTSSLFSDSSCATPMSSVTVAAGSGSARAYFKGTRAGPVTIDVQAAGLGTAQQTEFLSARAPAQLVFVTAPQTVAAGACSGVATVELQDAFGNPSSTSAARTVGLAAAPAAGFAFFSDPGCASAVSTVSIAAAGTRASFFFRDTTVGPVQVTASSAGLTSAPQTETVVAGAPAALAFSTAAQSRAAGACSGAVGLEVRDTMGNPSPVLAATTVALAAAPGTGFALYSDAACASAVSQVVVGAGASSVSFYFQGTLATGQLITATSAPLAPASQMEAIVPGADSQLGFLNPPRTVNAGACSASLDLAVLDAFGNQVPQAAPRSVALTPSPAGGLTFYSDSSCATAITTASIPLGASAVPVYARGAAAGPVNVLAQSAAVTSANQTVTVIPGASPTQLVFITPARTAAAGQCSAVLTVQSQDSFNNPRSVAADATVTLSALPAGAAQLFSDSGCLTPAASVTIPAGTDRASFYLRGTLAGPGSATATSAPLNPATQGFTVVPAPPSRLVFTTAPQTLPAGQCSGVATVRSEDPSGNASAPGVDTAVVLSSGAGITFYSDAACSTAAGSVTLPAASTVVSFFFRGTVAGARTLTATAGALTPATQPATITTGAPTRLVFTTAPLTATAGVCSPAATVQVQDAYGNPVLLGSALPVDLTQAGAAVTFFTGACATATTQLTIPVGSSTATFTLRGTQAGPVTATATSAGLTAVNQVETVNPAPADRLVFLTAPQPLAAGVCSAAATVEARDPYGNVAPVGAALTVTLGAAPATGFSFAALAGCGTSVGSVTIAAGASQASFFFRGTQAGPVVVTATGGSLTPATQTEVISPAAAASFQWNALPATVTLGVPLAVTVRALDAYGNVATGFVQTATLSVSPGTTTVACASACTNATTTDAFGAGVWSGTVTLGGATGTGRALSATQGALTGTSSAFEVVAPAVRTPPLAKFTATPRAVLAGATVSFDASGSSDLQTPAASLEVSWDFLGTAPGAPPWTAWTTTKTAVNTFATPGVYGVRLAVRDADGDVGYAMSWVHVLPAASPDLCVVDTASTADDGATSCSAKGPDGKLSLVEANRLSNSMPGKQTITFSGPMTITGSGPLNHSDSVDVVGVAGVLLVGYRPNINAAGAVARWYGLELSGSTAVNISNGNARFEVRDSFLHNFGGITNRGTLVLEGVTLSDCSDVCVNTNGNTTVRFSELRNTPAFAAIELSACSGAMVLDLSSSVFHDVQMGVHARCNGTTLIRNNTFHATGTAVSYQAGTGHVLVNNVFTTATTAAVECGSALFTTRSTHLLFNASPGCVGTDPGTLSVDPLYAGLGTNDYRLSFGSPAVDSALDVGLKLTAAGPGNFLGAGPDRGGRETW